MLVSSFVKEYLKNAPPDATVLDVGAGDVNGAYRALFTPYRYYGLDQSRQPNVEIVGSAYALPFVSGRVWDVVVSGQLLEHLERPWVAVNEMARVLKPGGLVCLVAPREWPVHRFPLDCFRILEDGMRSMMQSAGLTVLECRMVNRDTIGIGRKEVACTEQVQ